MQRLPRPPVGSRETCCSLKVKHTTTLPANSSPHPFHTRVRNPSHLHSETLLQVPGPHLPQRARLGGATISRDIHDWSVPGPKKGSREQKEAHRNT